MKKLLTDVHGVGEAPSVDQVIERIASALHARVPADWMRKMEVQPETVRTWRKRGKIPSSQLMKVSELSGRPVEWFTRWRYLDEEEPSNFFPGREKQISRTEEKQEQERSTDPSSDFLFVPQLNVRTSAGAGQMVEEEIEIGRFAFRRSWIERKGLIPGKLRVISARGRSMEPTVRDGDILLVDTSEQLKLSEGMYVIDYGGESRCKRLMPLVDGGLRICSDNPEWPAEEVKPGAIDQVRLVGKIIWIGGER